MKKLILNIVSIFTLCGVLQAQTPYSSPYDMFNSVQETTMVDDTIEMWMYHYGDTLSIYGKVEFDKNSDVAIFHSNNDSISLKPLMVVKWNVDPHAGSYPDLSPYAFVGNMPISAIDPDGRDIYILFHTSGNSRGDEMFRASALTRKVDIERSKGFDPAKDKVVVLSIKDMASIKKDVGNIIATYSPKYGQTQEFSIWSHAGLDGPTGTVPTSENAHDGKQMTLEGWGQIDFNWKNGGDGANANFFGCRTGVDYTKKVVSNYYPNINGVVTPEYTVTRTSFAKQISNLSNFTNVDVAGQMSSAYPSQFTNYRLNSENGADNFINSENNGVVNFQRTYLVGGVGRGQDWNLNEQNVAKPMQHYSNGSTTGTSFQTGTTR